MELQQYWQAIQNKVCTQCIHGDGRGNCNLPSEEECAVKVFLPEIVMTVVNAQEGSYERYRNVLRRQVCILCDRQLTDMSCQLRDKRTCALELYSGLVAEVIRGVRDQIQSGEVQSSTV